jgi:hypothetical protein
MEPSTASRGAIAKAQAVRQLSDAAMSNQRTFLVIQLGG